VVQQQRLLQFACCIIDLVQNHLGIALQVRHLTEHALHSELRNMFQQMRMVRSMAAVISNSDAASSVRQYHGVQQHRLSLDGAPLLELEAVSHGVQNRSLLETYAGLGLSAGQGRTLLQQQGSTAGGDPCDPTSSQVSWTPDDINPSQSKKSFCSHR
jgi:hypothetical protein